MNWIRLSTVTLLLILSACQSIGDKDTIAGLRHVQIEIKEEKIEGGLEKALLSYQRFLKETPESSLTPEAIRRLADLKIEKEYGTLPGGAEPAGQAKKIVPPVREHTKRPESSSITSGQPDSAVAPSVTVFTAPGHLSFGISIDIRPHSWRHFTAPLIRLLLGRGCSPRRL